MPSPLSLLSTKRSTKLLGYRLCLIVPCVQYTLVLMSTNAREAQCRPDASQALPNVALGAFVVLMSTNARLYQCGTLHV